MISIATPTLPLATVRTRGRKSALPEVPVKLAPPLSTCDKSNESLPIAYVVDSDNSVRGHVKSAALEAGFVVRQYAEAGSFLADFRVEQLGCVVLDLNLPDVCGLTLQRMLIEQQADLPRLFLAGHDSARSAAKAMQEGAFDVLQKPVDRRQLTARLQIAVESQRNCRRQLEKLAKWRKAFSEITLRETQVFRLVVEGKPNKAIARHLGVGEPSVETYRCRLMKKLGAVCLTDLIQIWMALHP